MCVRQSLSGTKNWETPSAGFCAAPGFMIKLILGEFGSVLLKGQRVIPPPPAGCGLSLLLSGDRRSVAQHHPGIENRRRFRSGPILIDRPCDASYTRAISEESRGISHEVFVGHYQHHLRKQNRQGQYRPAGKVPSGHHRPDHVLQHCLSLPHGSGRAAAFLDDRLLLDHGGHVHAGVRRHHFHQRHRPGLFRPSASFRCNSLSDPSPLCLYQVFFRPLDGGAGTNPRSAGAPAGYPQPRDHYAL